MALLTEQIDTQNDAVLAIRESLNAVVARRAERFAAPVALYDSNILAVIGTIHYFLSSTKVVPETGSPG